MWALGIELVFLLAKWALYWLALLPVLLVQNFPWNETELAWSWDHSHIFLPWPLCSLHSICVSPESIPSTHHSFQNLPGFSFRDPILAQKPFLVTWEERCLCSVLSWVILAEIIWFFTGCVLFDCMMRQDGFEMPLASWHPMVSNARLVLGTSRRACWSWYRREGVLVLREASHYFRLSVF